MSLWIWNNTFLGAWLIKEKYKQKKISLGKPLRAGWEIFSCPAKSLRFFFHQPSAFQRDHNPMRASMKMKVEQTSRTPPITLSLHPRGSRSTASLRLWAGRAHSSATALGAAPLQEQHSLARKKHLYAKPCQKGRWGLQPCPEQLLREHRSCPLTAFQEILSKSIHSWIKAVKTDMFQFNNFARDLPVKTNHNPNLLVFKQTKLLWSDLHRHA